MENKDYYFYDIEKAKVNLGIINILKEIKKNNNIINERLNSVAKLDEKLSKKKTSKCIADLVKKTLSLFLSITITVNSGIGVFHFSKKLANQEYYKKNITTYSTLNGLKKNEKKVEIKEVNSENLEKIYLNVYDAWKKTNDGYERIVKEYDISNYKFNDIKEYLNYSVDYYDVDYVSRIEKVDKPNINNLYSNQYVEVQKSVIDNLEVIEYFDPISFIPIVFSMYSAYLFILYGILYFSGGKFIFGQGIDILKILKNIIQGNCLTKNDLRKLDEINNEILSAVKRNDVLGKNFIRLYEENKYLLDNPEELYRRFYNLIKESNSNDVKKLIRENA